MTIWPMAMNWEVSDWFKRGRKFGYDRRCGRSILDPGGGLWKNIN